MNAIRKIAALLFLIMFSTSALATITDVQLFAWAAATYPQYFSGTPTAGQLQTYDYRFYPTTNIYLVVDTSTGDVYGLIGSTGEVVPLGNLTDFATSITAWQANQPSSGRIALETFNPLPNATVGQAYSNSVVQNISPLSTYTYSIDTLANGNGVPPSMTLNMNGILSGTPFATGAADVNGNQVPHTYTFGVCATDTLSRTETTPCPQTSITVVPASTNLTVSLAGSGSGTITSSPAGISCGAICSGSFTSGSSVTLTATPSAGSTFTGWSGTCSGNGSCTFSPSGNVSVTATFTANPTCSNGATNYPTCTLPTCSNGATNYPTCTLPTCSNGATNYPTCTLPTCSNGATNYPTCTLSTCSNGSSDYPYCTAICYNNYNACVAPISCGTQCVNACLNTWNNCLNSAH